MMTQQTDDPELGYQSWAAEMKMANASFGWMTGYCIRGTSRYVEPRFYQCSATIYSTGLQTPAGALILSGPYEDKETNQWAVVGATGYFSQYVGVSTNVAISYDVYELRIRLRSDN
jgi:hypothetical protein